jgi:hypothetical protein
VPARDKQIQPSEAALAEIDDLFLSNEEIPPRLRNTERTFPRAGRSVSQSHRPTLKETPKAAFRLHKNHPSKIAAVLRGKD